MLEFMIVALLFVYGLILGSFINAFVWRHRKKRDWVKERSECIHCHHILAPKDLIPVVSWLLLKGKCRYCHKKIEDTPITELGLALTFVLSYAFWPFSLGNSKGVALFGVWLLVVCIFATLCLYDFKWFLLPDNFTYIAIPIAACFALLRSSVSSEHSILAAVIGSITCFGIFYILFQISAGKWIGGGDVKLALSLGLLAGSFGGALMVIFVSSVLGTVYALPLIVRHKRLNNLRVPYGPFLMAATLLSVLFYGRFYGYFLGQVIISF